MSATPARTPAVQADVFNNTLTLNFPLTKGTPELSIDVTTLSPEIYKQAALHGLKQKLADAAAIARNPVNGATASPDDKYAAVKLVFDRLTGPNATWNAIREGVERNASPIFVRAVAEATGKDIATTSVNIKAMTKEQQAALKKNVRIVDIMQRMEREAVAAAGNVGDDLLAMLSGEGIPAGSEGAGEEPGDAPMVSIPDRRTKKQKEADAAAEQKRRAGN